MHTRLSQELHDEMIRRMINILASESYYDVKADIPGYSRPATVANGGRSAEALYVPDLTAKRREKFYLFEMETPDTLFDSHVEEQWPAFFRFARSEGGEFWLIVPDGCSEAARNRLAQLNLPMHVLEI